MRKKALEYSFRNSGQKEISTLLLDDYSITIRSGATKEVISYANVLFVRMRKSSDQVFRTHVHADGHRAVAIPSRSFSQAGEVENQSQAYSLFVRVLHHHLKFKSHAVFTFGASTNRIWQWAAFSAILSFAISLEVDYLGFSIMNPYIQAVILALMATLVVVTYGVKALPKTYNPAEIPLQFLP